MHVALLLFCRLLHTHFHTHLCRPGWQSSCCSENTTHAFCPPPSFAPCPAPQASDLKWQSSCCSGAIKLSWPAGTHRKPNRPHSSSTASSSSSNSRVQAYCRKAQAYCRPSSSSSSRAQAYCRPSSRQAASACHRCSVTLGPLILSRPVLLMWQQSGHTWICWCAMQQSYPHR